MKVFFGVLPIKADARAKNFRVREALLRKSNRCLYCNCKVHIYPGVTQQSNDTATVDHIYTRQDIRRLLSERQVLCCKKCNVIESKKSYNLVAELFNQARQEIFDIRTLILY